jgi:hypothetical protein
LAQAHGESNRIKGFKTIALHRRQEDTSFLRRKRADLIMPDAGAINQRGRVSSEQLPPYLIQSRPQCPANIPNALRTESLILCVQELLNVERGQLRLGGCIRHRAKPVKRPRSNRPDEALSHFWFQAVIGLTQFVIALGMLVGYHKAGVWGAF